MNKWVYLGIGMLVGVVFAPKLRSLPLLNKVA